MQTTSLSEPDFAVVERKRCVSALRERAHAFEQKKLFHIARALLAVAEEIDASGADSGHPLAA